MLCSFAPFADPAGCFIRADAPPRMPACFEPPPPVSPCVYEYDGIDTTQTSVPLAAAAANDEPTTPVAELRAPFSYGNDTACTDSVISGTKKTTEEDASSAKNKKMEPSWTYDADIDATFRKMEKDPAERPSETDIWTMQKMTMADRAHLVKWMYACYKVRDLPSGTLHRAVNYLDRYLSLKKMDQGQRLLLAITTVFAAAKYEDSATRWDFDPDDVAQDVGGGCTRSQVLAMERDLVATLGYNLSGPTAYTFVEHFTRHDDDQETAKQIKSLAHHLAEFMLLDYRSAESLPSAVAASAIVLATRRVTNSDGKTEELLKMTGYKLDDLIININDDIYEMHDQEEVWPGCALKIVRLGLRQLLAPSLLLIDDVHSWTRGRIQRCRFLWS